MPHLKVSEFMRTISSTFFIMVFFFLQSPKIFSQADCVLGVGAIKDSVLIDVFQLNSEQSEKLANLNAEIKYRNEILDNKLENIRKRHPQRTVNELTDLATEYNVIMDSMQVLQAMVDKKLLALFNQKQYTLYRNLCLEASRSPFIVAPIVYNDTVVVKKRSTFLNNLDNKN